MEPGVSGVIAVDVWYVSMIVVDVFPATRKCEKLLRQRLGFKGSLFTLKRKAPLSTSTNPHATH